MLDTGAAISVITENLARFMGIRGVEIKEALGSAGKKINIMLARVDSMTIGETIVKDIQVGIMK